MNIFDIAIWLAIGVVIGSIAGKIMGGKKKALWVNTLFGIAGSIVGGFLASFLGISGGLVVVILVAIGGACLLIFLARLLKLTK